MSKIVYVYELRGLNGAAGYNDIYSWARENQVEWAHTTQFMMWFPNEETRTLFHLKWCDKIYKSNVINTYEDRFCV